MPPLTQFNIKTNISRKAKHVSLRIKHDAEYGAVCIVVVPFRKNSILQNLLLQKAKIFIQTKREWISKHIEKYKKVQEKIKKERGVSEVGGDIGRETGGEFNRDTNLPNIASKISEKELKARTLKVVLERLEHFNSFYNFKYKDVRVKKVSTRWGSCSRKGNLNFSHKLGLMRSGEIDYVVVHELCHLVEFNHGPKFWKLVEQTIPNYKQIRKGMRGVI